MARGRHVSPDRRGRTRIGTRLALLLVVPLAGLVAMTAIQATAAVRQYQDAADLRARARVAVAATRLADALQDERTAMAESRTTGPRLRGAVERGVAQLRDLRADVTGADRELLDRALGRAAAAGALAANGSGGVVAVDGYSPAIRTLLRLSDLSLIADGAAIGRPASVADLLAVTVEATSRERGLLTAVSAGQSLSPAQLRLAAELAATQQLLPARAASAAGRELAADIEAVADSASAAATTGQRLFNDGRSSPETRAWLATADERVATLRELRDRATTEALAAVDALAASSARTLAISGLALVATILVSLLLVRGATRSIARPLSQLAARAEEVALSRLPEAVRAQQQGEGDAHLPRIRAAGAAEVHEVAAAFNDVQDTALRLASEQAVLRRNQAEALTNLGRRNQTLLGRQLDFISDLEKRETDPAFLEHLFRLDHLASRMRRNAESLLILAGSETPRRRRRPAAVTEVVRAAMSEVEDFERVRLGRLGEATLTGPVVIDLVHLVAELVENALNFSPPTTTVEVDGRTLGQGGYQLAVIDHGVGMTDVELQAANLRMSGQDESVGVPTRFLGQYVIARLAEKTGAIVRLQPTVGGRGVTAVVTLPAAAMVGGPDPSDVARPLPGTRAALEQGPAPVAPGAGLVRVQPDPVVDPEADPFAEPAPVLEGGWEHPLSDPLPAPLSHVAPSAPAVGPAAPPPVPEAVPVQDDWEPAVTTTAPWPSGAPEPVAAVPAFGDPMGDPFGDPVAGGPMEGPFPAGDLPSPDELLAPYADGSVGAAVDGAVGPSAPAWVPPAASPVVDPPPAEPPAAGLARRVPGASLARSPLGRSDPEVVATGERSADGVRSMLAAFQSGRARGRTDGRAEDRSDVSGAHETMQQGPTAPGWEESR
jgi:signal transduction histidine kinase